MNLLTARLLVPVTRRQDFSQDRLSWLPDSVYEDAPSRREKDED